MKNDEEKKRIILDLAVLAGLFVTALVLAICL